MRFLRRLYHFYLYRRYGICPIHAVLCRAGGGYEPKWICGECDNENEQKHKDRNLRYERNRLIKLAKYRGLSKKAQELL